MHRTKLAEAGDVAIARRIATQEVVGIHEGILTVFVRAQHLVGIEQRKALTAAFLGQTAPSEVASAVAIG